MSAEQRVGSICEAFLNEGATKVHYEMMASLQAENMRPSVLAIHDTVAYDRTSEQMKDNHFYRDLVSEGVGVNTLGREFDHGPDPRGFADEELNALQAFASRQNTLLTLEASPTRILSLLSETPPTITALYRSAPERQNGGLADLQSALACGKVALCTTDSQAAADAYRGAGIPSGSLRVIPNGINLNRFRPSLHSRRRIRSELEIAQDAPVVLSPTRFSPEKNIGLLLKTCREYLAREKSAHVVVAGGSMNPNKNQHLKALLGDIFEGSENPASRLHMLGGRPDIEAVYAAADVVALTSRTESYPLSLIEGLATGAVGVATDVGDSKIILDGCGSVVDKDAAPQDIATAWQETYSRRAELRVSGKRRAEFGTERMVAAYVELIREVAA